MKALPSKWLVYQYYTDRWERSISDHFHYLIYRT